MVKYAFIFSDSFAVTVEACSVLDPTNGDENGARIQIRRVTAGAEPGTQLGEPVWRGDLFKLTRGPKDNWDRAHYHPRFSGMQAGQRQFDPQLSKDPLNWALTQLSDLRGLAARAAAPDLAAAAGELQPQVDAVRDEMLVALQKCAAAPPPAQTTT
ncbi:MAG: hypothetical protein ACR2IK_24075 [Chloroflexota bacterium]